MATHSSILAWRIPWTSEHCGLQPMGLQRVGPDWSDLVCMPCFKEALTLLTLFTIMADEASELINSLFSPLAPDWEKHTCMPPPEGTGHWYTFFHQVECFSAPLHRAQANFLVCLWMSVQRPGSSSGEALSHFTFPFCHCPTQKLSFWMLLAMSFYKSPFLLIQACSFAECSWEHW